jgi:hypothetical protein
MRISLLVIFVFLCILSNAQLPERADYLVKYNLVKQHTKASISAIWKKRGIPKLALPVKNDVDIYEIFYNAPSLDQKSWRVCSGICYVPRNMKKKQVPTLMFGHGTEISKGRTISDDDAQQGITLSFATDGYLGLYPDYYGMGNGEGNHIYQHAWSEAMAFIYMLKAVEELKPKWGIQTNGQIFLTGYSQGGHSSMAAHKYLEELNDPRFKVTASSPMSGAYDMTGEQAKYMFEVYPKPFYLPYLMISYQEAYKILETQDIYSAFRPPYDSIVKLFFDGERTRSFGELDRILPNIPANVISEPLLKQYINDDKFPFKVRLVENNLTDWKPVAPMQLCYCKGDREVNYKNAEVAYTRMTNLGAKNVRLKNFSDYLDHNTCAAFAVLSTKYFFDRFKKKGKNPKFKDVPPFKQWIVNMIKKKEEKKYLATGKDDHY